MLLQHKKFAVNDGAFFVPLRLHTVVGFAPDLIKMRLFVFFLYEKKTEQVTLKYHCNARVGFFHKPALVAEIRHVCAVLATSDFMGSFPRLLKIPIMCGSPNFISYLTLADSII